MVTKLFNNTLFSISFALSYLKGLVSLIYVVELT